MLDHTNTTQHVIDKSDAPPIKIPPHPIPFHYADKPSGKIRICVDYVKLNSVTKKDSYPVPCAEGPQQKLAGKKVFAKLDLCSAYWQFLMRS